MNLNGALLYVVQNLSIGDGVSGKGAIVVRGNLTIGRGASLSTDNQAALLCGGDVVIGGSGTPDDSSFQGLVYTKGSFTASNVSLFGTFLDGGGTSANMSFNNVRAVRVPEYSVMLGGESGQGPPAIRIGASFSGPGFGYFNDLSPEVQDTIHYYLENPDTGWSPSWDIKPNGEKFDLYQDGNFVKTYDSLFLEENDPNYNSPNYSIRGYMYDFFTSKWANYVNSKYGGAEFVNWLKAKNNQPPHNYYPSGSYSVITHMIEDWADKGNGLYVCFGSITSTGGSINIDLGQFLRAEDRMQILIWRSVN